MEWASGNSTARGGQILAVVWPGICLLFDARVFDAFDRLVQWRLERFLELLAVQGGASNQPRAECQKSTKLWHLKNINRNDKLLARHRLPLTVRPWTRIAHPRANITERMLEIRKECRAIDCRLFKLIASRNKQ